MILPTPAQLESLIRGLNSHADFRPVPDDAHSQFLRRAASALAALRDENAAQQARLDEPIALQQDQVRQLERLCNAPEIMLALARQREYERLFSLEYGKLISELTAAERTSLEVFAAHERAVARLNEKPQSGVEFS